MTATSPPLQRAIDAMAVPGILVGHRLIADGDELALLPEELACVCRQRDQGAARQRRRAHRCATNCCRASDKRRAQSRSPPAGMPVWPDGIVGSLAHDSEVAIAAMARAARIFRASGSMSSRPSRSPPICWTSSPRLKERARQSSRPDSAGSCHGRLLFSIKEAIYKAVYPLDRTFLDHHDVEVRFVEPAPPWSATGGLSASDIVSRRALWRWRLFRRGRRDMALRRDTFLPRPTIGRVWVAIAVVAGPAVGLAVAEAAGFRTRGPRGCCALPARPDANRPATAFRIPLSRMDRFRLAPEKPSRPPLGGTDLQGSSAACVI